MSHSLISLKAAIVIVAVLGVLYMGMDIRASREEIARLRANNDALMGDIERYRVRDSLSGARVESLELTLREFERYRAEDAALIKDLRGRNRDLAAVNKAQSETIVELMAVGRDTIIIRDSIPIPATAFHCGDRWYDFDGIVADGVLTGEMRSRDSLVIVESVKYRRFLGFLWKTHRIESRWMDCVSKNPHTTILDVEHIIINN